METNEQKSPDLLSRVLANRLMRTLIAVALLVQVAEVYYSAGKCPCRAR